jgi:ribosome-associated toxin RatA of RatAB toxin-antitoxin module
MVSTTTMSAFARPTTSNVTFTPIIMYSTKTTTATSPTRTTITTMSNNKSSMITITVRAQQRTMINNSCMLKPRKNLREQWEVKTTQNLCTNQLILRFQAKKEPNHIHILTFLFHFLQVSREGLIHVYFLTNGHNLIIVLIDSLGTLLKPKVLFTYLINPSDGSLYQNIYAQDDPKLL